MVTNSYSIGCLGLTDAANALANGCSLMTYNGYAFSEANIQNGQYTLWSYEHCYKNTNGANNGLIDTIADCIFKKDADAIYSPGLTTAQVTAGDVEQYTTTSGALVFVDGINHAENGAGFYSRGLVKLGSGSPITYNAGTPLGRGWYV